MDATRALFASIGVSVSLVAAAALSLFAVSVVIAFGGWSAGLGGSEPTATLVFGPTGPVHAKQMRATGADHKPVVLKAPAPQRPRTPAGEPSARVIAKPSDARAISNAAVSTAVPQPSNPQPIVTPPTLPAHKTPTGDGVRRAGQDLSSVAHNAGKALSDATAPLAPPVSAAVQKVLDLVAALLQRTTNALGGTVDTLGQK